MNDSISRQAVIEAIDRHTFDTNEGLCLDDDITCILEEIPSAQPDKRLEKIADLVEGTIDHFDREDAMDLLYQIKEVLNER